MKVSFIFSGQGAQKVGMGKDLQENSEAAAKIFAKADEVLGWSVSDVCFNGPEDKLKESIYCQPAIYTMSVACLETFKEKNPNVTPIALAGLSLGEYAALYASGAFSFEEGLKLLVHRSKFMNEACKENNGSMASVLGGDVEVIQNVCNEVSIDVANYNCPGQIVISGEADSVGKAVDLLKEKGVKRAIQLNVAGAFHSKLMKSAGEKLATVLKEADIQNPQIPVYQNYIGNEVKTDCEIRKNLANQVMGSVRWEECIKKMIEQGSEQFIEFGPGNVLTGLLKRTDKTINRVNINSIASLDSFA